ncbi:heterokaryon incompatibility protein-domain-containing protein [Apiospora rasikravindrae]|uniref:Heterokaryon incompatibility protein-domain-containing protein n=1 Tax=Apiospora rasikravindrae TaxID=990691 RepID=A0ABR1TWG6_9PEZI
MTTIYGSAMLTIAATGSSSAHEGLFVARPPSLLAGRRCKIRVRSSSPTNAVLVLQRPWGYKQSSRGIVGPLERRGWAFQEKVLSPRFLSYGRDGMSWKCQCTIHEEILCTQVEVGTNIFGPKALYTSWPDQVKDYSARDLTVMGDRLRAIEGVARLIQTEVNVEYLSGIWKEQLLTQLMWRHIGAAQGGHRIQDLDQADGFPSWSWASVSGSVHFLLKRPTPVKADDLTITQSTNRIQHRNQADGLSSRPRALLTGAAELLSKRLTITDDSLPLICGASPKSIYLVAQVEEVGAIQCLPSADYAVFHPEYGLHMDLRTYIDDLEAIPSHHTKRMWPDGTKRITNVVFMYLEDSRGLILLETKSTVPEERLDAPIGARKLPLNSFTPHFKEMWPWMSFERTAFLRQPPWVTYQRIGFELQFTTKGRNSSGFVALLPHTHPSRRGTWPKPLRSQQDGHIGAPPNRSSIIKMGDDMVPSWDLLMGSVSANGSSTAKTPFPEASFLGKDADQQSRASPQQYPTRRTTE